jgi:hypothetical protein
MHGAYLEQSQVVVGIYWQRYRRVGPGTEISGLECGYGLAAGKPMLVVPDASGSKPGAGAHLGNLWSSTQARKVASAEPAII